MTTEVTNNHSFSNSIHKKIQISDNPTAASFMEKMQPIVEKVKEIAKFILAVGFSALLFWVNPSLFAIGFIAGMIIDDHVRHAIQKIKNVWNSQKLAGCFFGSFACALSLPVTLATASLLWSAHLGSLLVKDLPSLDEKTQMFPGASNG